MTLLFSLCVGWKGFPRSHWTAWSSRVPRTWGANRTQRREGGFGIRSSSRWGCWVGLNMDLIRNNHLVIVRIVASLREQPQIRVCIPNHAMNRWIRVCVRLVFPNVLWTSQGSDGPEGLSGPKGIRVSLLPLLLSCYVIFYKTLPSDSFMRWITFYWFFNVFFLFYKQQTSTISTMFAPKFRLDFLFIWMVSLLRQRQISVHFSWWFEMGGTVSEVLSNPIQHFRLQCSAWPADVNLSKSPKLSHNLNRLVVLTRLSVPAHDSPLSSSQGPPGMPGFPGTPGLPVTIHLK